MINSRIVSFNDKWRLMQIKTDYIYLNKMFKTFYLRNKANIAIVAMKRTILIPKI